MVSDEHAQPPVEQTEVKPAAEAPKEGATPAPTEEKKTMATKTKKTAKKTAKKAAKKSAAKKVSTVKRDEFGLRDGSKASQAAAMFARANGATMAQVKEKIGGTVYNLLKSLKAKGHKVTDKDGVYTLRAK